MKGCCVLSVHVFTLHNKPVRPGKMSFWPLQRILILNEKNLSGIGKRRFVSTPNTLWSNTASEIFTSARHFAQETKVTKQKMLIDKWVAKSTSRSKGTWIRSSELLCTDLPCRITHTESTVLMPGPTDSKVSYMSLRVLNSTRWTSKVKSIRTIFSI